MKGRKETRWKIRWNESGFMIEDKKVEVVGTGCSLRPITRQRMMTLCQLG